MTERTLFDLVLEAASTLPDECHKNDIVVAAWHLAPQRFGLAGYGEQHPDANRIIVCLSGNRGLVHAGLLEKVAPNRYKLTHQGRQRVQALQQGGKVAPIVATKRTVSPLVKLTRPQEAFLQHVYASRAWALWSGEQRAAITFADASALWGDDFEAMLAGLCNTLRPPQEAVPSDGRSVEARDVAMMEEMDAGLRARFKRHLGLLAARRTA